MAEDPSQPARAEVIVGFDRERLEGIARRVTAGGAPSAASASPASEGPPRLGLLARDGPAGVEVGGVRPDSLAERAGLCAGDVVEALDGQPVRTVADLDVVARRLAAGGGAELLVRRGDQRRRVRLSR